MLLTKNRIRLEIRRCHSCLCRIRRILDRWLDIKTMSIWRWIKKIARLTTQLGRITLLLKKSKEDTNDKIAKVMNLTRVRIVGVRAANQTIMILNL